ncbi:hypothetical protein DKK68_06190 [Bifidobacterium asteroides]|nr:hypothetical protein DKK68_06190 [Bifidobacterium asteroides]
MPAAQCMVGPVGLLAPEPPDDPPVRPRPRVLGGFGRPSRPVEVLPQDQHLDFLGFGLLAGGQAVLGGRLGLPRLADARLLAERPDRQEDVAQGLGQPCRRDCADGCQGQAALLGAGVMVGGVQEGADQP